MGNVKMSKVIKQLSITLEKHANILMKSKDITSTQGVVLLRIKESEDATTYIKDLEHCFQTAQSTMYGIIGRLETKGLITSSIDEKKNKVVAITKDGETLVEFVKESLQMAESEVFASLTDTEYAILSELMKKISETSIARYFKDEVNND